MGKEGETGDLDYNSLGEEAYAQGDYLSALDFFKKDINHNPEHLYSYFLIGYIYSEYINDFANALVYFKKYAEKEPQDAKIYVIIGHLYKKFDYYGYLDEQIQYFKKALTFMPDSKEVMKSLAYAYLGLEKSIEATRYFQKSFNAGTSANDYFIYGCQQMKLGNFDEGWKYYEYRFFKEYGKTHYPSFENPKWEGQLITNKTLLVQNEQGFGDSLQFSRYLQKVKPMCARVIFRVQDELEDLFKINASGIEIVAESTPINELSFDFHVPMMDLVRLMDKQLDEIPFSEGYIMADTNKTEQYRNEFFDNNNLKIGISWHGAENGNNLRNILLKVFYPLTKIKNVKVYSFQKGLGSEQLEHLPPEVEIVDLGKTFHNFSDTAAAMANLDLFISSDNGVFNLAGAMGKKAFLLLNKPCNWRWFFDEKSTRWYKNVRIFKKQSQNEDWEVLMKKIITTFQ